MRYIYGVLGKGQFSFDTETGERKFLGANPGPIVHMEAVDLEDQPEPQNDEDSEK